MSKQFCSGGHDTFLCGRTKWDQCRDCIQERRDVYQKEIQDYYKQYYQDNKDKIIQDQAEYHTKNKEKIALKNKENYLKNRERRRKKGKEYYEANKEKILKRTRKYAKKHPEIYKLARLRKTKRRRLRIPKWGQEGVLEFYKNCPKNKEIDHVIPLCGKKVSGLHVRWNLQYLTPLQNQKKSNEANLTKISEQYSKLLEELGLK